MMSQSPDGIQPVRRLKLADAVAAQLTQLIASGEYVPGDRLPSERELSDQFGVGHSTLREALRSLEADGLVRSDHGVGIFVISPVGKPRSGVGILLPGNISVSELFEVRIPLERDAAGLAAKRITSGEVAVLLGLIQAASEPGVTDAEFIRLDVELHRSIALAAKNQLLSRLFSNLEPLFFTYSQQVIDLPDRRARAHVGHVRIVEAVVRRKVQEARAAAVAHIGDVERDIVGV